MPLTPVAITLLEKVAVDNGFDLELARDGDWIGFASTHAPLRVWLTALGDSVYLVALSQHNVARALSDHGSAFTNPLPAGACAARGVANISALHRVVRRAFQLARTLPDELLHVFEKKVAALPRTTEIERLVVQRVGQNVFRDGLMDYWEGRCAITGLAVPELLRASHIKPWAACDTDAERLDIFNGFLLAAHLDAMFDGGLITIRDDRGVVVSHRLEEADRQLLNVTGPIAVRALTDAHRAYLAWHRARVFRT
jgi:putative restriction endonuclease